MRRRSKLAVLLAILIGSGGSMVVALGLGEVLVRTLRPQNCSGIWLETAPRGYRWNTRDRSVEHQLLPLAVRYTFGANRTRGTPPPGRIKVMSLGDSYTFGWLVEQQQTWVGRLQASCDEAFGSGAVAWHNLGTAGTGTAEHLALLEDCPTAPKADLVVLFCNGDDARRMVVSKLYALSDGGELAALSRPPPSFLREWAERSDVANWALEHSHLLQLVRRATLPKPLDIDRTRTQQEVHDALAEAESRFLLACRATDPIAAMPESVRPDLRLWSALVRAIRDRAAKLGARLIVVKTGIGTNFQAGFGHVAGGSRIYDSLWAAPINRAALAYLPNLCAQLGVTIIDLDSAFNDLSPAEGSACVMPGDGHPTIEGHRRVAEAAWRELRPILEPLARAK